MARAGMIGTILTLFFVGVVPVRAVAYEYRSAHGLFEDCSRAAGTEQRQNCAEFLHTLLENWLLEQGDGVCSRVTVSALPDAYVQYWRVRGLGALSGEFRSALASVNDFLDSKRQPCPAK